jgi:CRP-like cAMP-binding protein
VALGVSFEASVEQRIELLRSVWLFSACTDDELARIAALSRPEEIESGTDVTVQGEEGLEFYVIVEGDARAAVDGDVVGTIGAGGFFGEMALIDGGERVATVTATSRMKVLVLDRHDFNEMLSIAMPEVTPKLLAVVGARMRTIEQHEGIVSTLGL